MNVLAIICFAVLMVFCLGVALGKLLAWSVESQSTPVDVAHDAEPYPRAWE